MPYQQYTENERSSPTVGVNANANPSSPPPAINYGTSQGIAQQIHNWNTYFETQFQQLQSSLGANLAVGSQSQLTATEGQSTARTGNTLAIVAILLTLLFVFKK